MTTSSTRRCSPTRAPTLGGRRSVAIALLAGACGGEPAATSPGPAEQPATKAAAQPVEPPGDLAHDFAARDREAEAKRLAMGEVTVRAGGVEQRLAHLPYGGNSVFLAPDGVFGRIAIEASAGDAGVPGVSIVAHGWRLDDLDLPAELTWDRRMDAPERHVRIRYDAGPNGLWESSLADARAGVTSLVIESWDGELLRGTFRSRPHKLDPAAVELAPGPGAADSANTLELEGRFEVRPRVNRPSASPTVRE